MDEVLDNPTWHALIGPQAALGIRHGDAARFDQELSPFTAIADDSPASWRDLGSLVGAGGTAVLAGSFTAPSDWQTTLRLDGFQMVGDAVEPLEDDEIVELGAADVSEMFELATRTRPGPFERRTPEFGGYLGIRRDGRLVAMAGERLRPPGWTEISAVCTDEQVRGQGLGGRLVRAVATRVARRGDGPMLHVAAGNAGAIRLYEQLGFRIRRPVTFLGATAPEESAPEGSAPAASD